MGIPRLRGSAALLAALIWLTAGCDAAPAPAPSAGPPTPTAAPASAGTPAALPSGVPTEAVPAATAAVQSLAQRLGIPAAQITVAAVTAHEWPTPALGCPQGGRAYAQVITPGYVVLLATGGASYEYHVDLAGHAVSCAGGTPGPGSP